MALLNFLSLVVEATTIIHNSQLSDPTYHPVFTRNSSNMDSLTGMRLTKSGMVLGRKLGEGACAVVYEIVGQDLVAKVAQLPTGKGKGKAAKEQLDRVNTLYFEYQVERYPSLIQVFMYISCLPARRPDAAL